MQHKYNMEAVDRTLRDILNTSGKPFGGLTFVFGGDFKQILPVIIKVGKAQTMVHLLGSLDYGKAFLCFIYTRICTLTLELRQRSTLPSGS